MTIIWSVMRWFRALGADKRFTQHVTAADSYDAVLAEIRSHGKIDVVLLDRNAWYARAGKRQKKLLS
jgi:hypothetical protein